MFKSSQKVMKGVLIGLAEAVYVVYMLNWFKTTVNLAHPLSYFENPLLYHPVHTLEKAINPVCTLGHRLSWLLGAYLITFGAVREYGLIEKSRLGRIHIGVLILTGVLSMLNFNVVAYLLPLVLFEVWCLAV